MKTIELADGYNGHVAKFVAEPIAIDGDLVKLQCAEPGKDYMIAWKYADQVAEAVRKYRAEGLGLY